MNRSWMIILLLFSFLVSAWTLEHIYGSADNVSETRSEIGEQIHAENEYMDMAIDEALAGITQKHGGPFGTVIVKDGEVVGRGHNMVLKNNDSTAHGEISAIRDAEARLETYDLTGCELYTTGEPCPMCLFACLWANIDRVYYGCTIADNSRIGFRDEAFDQVLENRDTFKDYLICIDRDACVKLFDVYSQMNNVIY